MTAEFTKRWEPAHTDYTVCMVAGALVKRDGEIDCWGGRQWSGPDGKRHAQRDVDRLNAAATARGSADRFEVRKHRRKGAWVHSMTISLPEVTR